MAISDVKHCCEGPIGVSRYLFSPLGKLLEMAICFALVNFFFIFNDFLKTNYCRIHWQIYTIFFSPTDRYMYVDDHSFIHSL